MFVSTDLVYSGSSDLDTTFQETDELRPCNVYAKHKEEVEHIVKDMSPNFVIVRGPFIYGLPAFPHSSATSFFLELLKNLKNGSAVQLFEDEFRTPCFIGDALDIIVNSVLKFVDAPDSEEFRVFNLTSGHTLSRMEFGEVRKKLLFLAFFKLLLTRSRRFFLTRFKALCEIFKLDNKLLIPRRLDDGSLVICGVQRQIIKCLALSAHSTKKLLGVSGTSVRAGLLSELKRGLSWENTDE
jgi:hypothetical protein